MNDVAFAGGGTPAKAAFTLEERVARLFPQIDPGREPILYRVIVQLKRAQKTSAGGILLPEEVVDIEQSAETFGKVVAIGPLAFKDQVTGEDRAGAPFFKIGDYVSVPRVKSGDNWKRKTSDGEEITFCLVNDQHVFSIVTALEDILA